MRVQGHSPWKDRASCEQPVTWVTATTPAVNMLLSLSHVAACGQSSYAAPASSRHDPPRARGHVDRPFGDTSVLTMPVSVRVSRCQPYLEVRHHLLVLCFNDGRRCCSVCC